MALTANRDLDHFIDQELRSLPVAAAKQVYKGAFVGLTSSGYAQPLTARDPFVGIAYEEIDNSGGADGDLSVRLYTLGDFGHALTGATVADIGRPVFASGDDTLAFDGAGKSIVGVVRDVPKANEIIVRINTDRGVVKTLTHMVEDLSAGDDITTRAIHMFDQDAWIVAIRIVNQVTNPSGIDDSNTCVVTLQTGAGIVVTTTFNSTTIFPSANQALDLGTLSNVHATGAAVLRFSITNGTTANPGAFALEVDYV